MTGLNYVNYASPIGNIMLVADDDALIGLWIKRQLSYVKWLRAEELVESETAVLKSVKEWLDEYFQGEKPDVERLEIRLRGTEFQKMVWGILRKIPYGETTSYGEIAREIAQRKGGKMSAQAVGGAVGKNPISIIVPCHRVLGADKKLTGYTGGLEIKKYLLELEGISWSG